MPDWLTELPQGNIGLWILFIVVLGGFVVAIIALRRKPTYIEFHGGWTANHDPVANSVTVSGRVTIISLAARMEATCRVQFGKVSALWLCYGRFGNPKGFDLALTSRGGAGSPNAYQLTFSGQDISIPGGLSEVAIAIRVKLSDGSQKRMARRLAPQPEDSTED